MDRAVHQSGPAGRNSGESRDGSTRAHPKISDDHSITTVSNREAGQNPESADRRSKSYLSVQAQRKRRPEQEYDWLVHSAYLSSYGGGVAAALRRYNNLQSLHVQTAIFYTIPLWIFNASSLFSPSKRPGMGELPVNRCALNILLEAVLWLSSPAKAACRPSRAKPVWCGPPESRAPELRLLRRTSPSIRSLQFPALS